MSSLRRIVLSMALTLLLPMIIYAPMHASQGLKYERTITIYRTGLILLRDHISGIPKDADVLSLKLSRNLTDGILGLKAEADSGTSLNVKIIQVSENESLVKILNMDSKASSLTLELLLNSSVLTWQQDSFILWAPVYPCLNLPVERLGFTLTIPTSSNFKQYPEGFNVSAHTLQLLKTGLEAEAARIEPISITGLSLVKVENFSRTVTVLEFGEVVVEDFYTVVNVGESAVSEITFTLPSNVFDTGSRDEFGDLEASTMKVEDYLKLMVKPRYVLERGCRYSLTVFYKFPAGSLTEHGLFKESHRFTLEVGLNLPVVVKSFRMNLRLPEHSTFVDAEPEGYVLSGDGRVLTWVLNASPLSLIENPPTFTVEYDYNVLWSCLKPVLWTSYMVIAISTVYYLRRFRAVSTAEVKPVAATREVSGFIEAYEEKLSLRRALTRLESDYGFGRISRSKFESRSSILKSRMAKLDETIKNCKPAVRSAGFSDELSIIEEAEADMSICDIGLRELRSRYRSGKISRQIYEKLLNEYIKRMHRSESRMRRALEHISL